MAAPVYDSVILGAGAAGLMCAITAARRGRRVLVLERSNKPGKKILMSGGGRCNFTNLHVAPDRYLSNNPHFCKSALSRYTQWDFIDMIERHGIDYFEKETVNGLSGQLFCHQSSKQVVSMLLDECARAGASIRLGCETGRVDHPGPFQLETSQGRLEAETLVVATGGLSIPSLGGSDFGYRLAEQFGMRLHPTLPGLAPLMFTGTDKSLFEKLSGVSCEAVVSVGDTAFREDLLFTHRGLSGPAILQASSHWRPGEDIRIDLLPGSRPAVEFLRWKSDTPRVLMRSRLDRLLPQVLVRELEKRSWSERSETPLAEWPDLELGRLAENLSAWKLRPATSEGYRKAEVTLGGVDTRDLSSKTMESTVSGLFFLGEVVDVTGELGGFNFQWAWSSGHVAGQAL